MMTQACVRFFLPGFFLLMLTAPRAGAWEAPATWSEIGTVRQWQATDAEFYRIQESAVFLDESHFNLDQRREYEKTFAYRGRLNGVTLAQWQDLAPDAQAARRAAAGHELRFLADFRSRVLELAQNARMNLPSGWGGRISDRTVVGDGLVRLRTAVALDPSNPFAWHLYSYFATLVGDESRALAALAGAEEALALVPAAQLGNLRAAVALDKAWLLRNRGEFEAASGSLEVVAANGGGGLEARVLEGLLAAQMGDDRTAITIANALRPTKVFHFPSNIREGGFAPELADVSTWRQSPSSYLADWILAYTWLREGRVDLARSAFGPHRLDAQRPLAHRFWNEAGLIYEATGRPVMAGQAWNQARITLAYYPYTVYKGYQVNLRRLTGRGGGVPYLLGFDTHFLSGSRLAYGAGLVEDLAAATDPLTRETLAARALEELEICRRFGVNAGQASVLRGQVYFLMGDLESARIEVDEALVHLEAIGDKAGFAAVLSGLHSAREELGERDIANFYGQSGNSRGRWQPDSGAEDTLADLRKAFSANPSDQSRQDLARHLIRTGHVAEGRELATAPLQGAAESATNLATLSPADVVLLLEADRATGQTDLAVALVAALQSGARDPWSAAGIWTLAGFVCLDNGLRDEGRAALERAVELDPGNHGLQVQLSLM